MPAAQLNAPPPTGEQLVRIDVDQYLQMTQSGALREGAPIELLDGLLVWKDRRDREGSIMTVGVRHSNCVVALDRFFDRACEGHGCHARSQQPVKLTEFDMPEPDLSIIRGQLDDYPDRHPNAEDVLLLVEVADSSLKQDREDKLRKYATAGIREYWIVNLLDNRFEVYSSPEVSRGVYNGRKEVLPGATVSITLSDGTPIRVEVSRMLP
jgi:Uma2 family endonuclease